MENKKSILFINPNQFGYAAGYFYYALYLRQYFNIYFICFDQGNKKINMDNIEVIYINHNVNKFFRIINFIIQSIKFSFSHNIDIIFLIYFNFSFIIGLFSRSKIKILDIRTGSIKVNKFQRFLNNKYITFQTMFFRNITILSNKLANSLRLKANKTHLLPLGSAIFYNGSHNYNQLNILYVGTLNLRRINDTIEGIYLFLKATNYKFELRYTIIGYGYSDEEKKIIDYINKFNLSKYVNYIGRKNYLELPYFFEKNNIGISWIPIMPQFNYQPATKTVEYILSGLYCIATNTYANRQLINNDNGVLINDKPENLCNALLNYIKNTSKLSSKNIRGSLIDYQWEKIVLNNLKPYLINKLCRK